MQKTPHTALCLLALLFVFVSTSWAGGLRLARYYSDEMVLQRDKPVAVRGFDDAGTTVTVSFGDQKKTATTDSEGAWSVTLDPMPANASGQDLRVSSSKDGSTVAVKNVVVGDVILFACQASIDVSLGKDDAGRAIAAQHGKTPSLRAITITTIPAHDPQPDLAEGATNGWHTLTPESAPAMSAAAYLFAKDLSSKVDVPVGVIDLNMGAAFPIGWLSRDALMQTEKFYGKTDVEGAVNRLERLYDAQQKGEQPKKEAIRTDALTYPLYPAGSYNAVLAPLHGLALKGIVLQLGGNYPYFKYDELDRNGTSTDPEALNQAYVETYDIRKTGFRMDPVTTPRIPREWRSLFGDEQLPIGWVMAPSSALGPLAMHAREMRDLQRRIARDNPHVSVILPGMDAVPFSVQPRDEKLLAQRCLAWALGSLYPQDDQPATGPTFDHIDTLHNTATVYFKPGSAAGLHANDNGAVEGFEVAGVEGDYVPASARIDGEVVRITSDTVNRITRVRYNWTLKPQENLFNSANLPAVPFRSEDAGYQWFFRHSEDELPIEYSTPANEWTAGNVTLINGQLKTFGYDNFSGWLGPVGVKVGPFGPNMGVREVLVGSPAEGLLHVGDVIYSANGKMLGDDAPRVMSQAITDSETMEMAGKLTLGVHRDSDNLDVVVPLEVMGTYSPTAPFDCPKSDKIVTQLERWLAARGGKDKDFLNTDLLFMLGAGSPEYQGLVRRNIYADMIGFKKGDNNWFLGFGATLLAEYYLSTGDRNVLPALQNHVDSIIENQIGPNDVGPYPNRVGGWYGNRHEARDYPAMPPAGLACMIGLTLAKEAGVKVDEEAYQNGIRYFLRKGANVCQIIYGNAWRDKPNPIDPNKMLKGELQSDNGKLAAGAILFNLAGDRPTAHNLSLTCSFAYNTTYGGHGGNFWNNYWTPLAANVQSDEAFIYFMKGHRWYRELNRRFDGCLIQTNGTTPGGGTGLALVAPRHRLRILGAPVSPFGVNAPEFLKSAVEAYRRRDYAGSAELANKLLDMGIVGKDDLPTVEKLAQEAQRMQQSIDADLARMDALIKEGRLYEAGLDVKQLEAVTPEGDARLAAIKEGLKGKARADDAALYQQAQTALAEITGKSVKPADGGELEWSCVVTERANNEKAKQNDMGKLPADQASPWRLKVVEDRDQAPEGWAEPGFDDASWLKTTLPISWRLNHTALLRTTFDIENPADIKGLRFRGWLFRQQNIAIYLNGKLIGRVNNLEEKTGDVDADFNEWATTQLKKGQNTLAVATQQNWRWGMLFMKVYNDGFGFRLDVGKKAR